MTFATRACALVVLLGIGLVLAACSSIRVHTDHDPHADFSRLRTWAWMERTPPADPIRENTLVRNRIRDAIERELASKGFVHVGAVPADFLVGFETTARDRVDVQSWPSWCCGGFGRRGWWHGWGHDVTVRQYTEGTLVVGVVQPASGDLLWRATASSVLDEDSGSAERVDEAAKKLFEGFPPHSR